MTYFPYRNNAALWARVPQHIREAATAAASETCGHALPYLRGDQILVSVYLDFPGHDDLCRHYQHKTAPRPWRAVRDELLTQGFVMQQEDCVEWVGPVVEEVTRVSPRYRVVDYGGDAAVVLYETNNAWLAKYYARFYGIMHVRDDLRVEDRQGHR